MDSQMHRSKLSHRKENCDTTCDLGFENWMLLSNSTTSNNKFQVLTHIVLFVVL